MHPLYDDEALVGEVTQRHLDAGRTVFQLWQAAPTEREHSVTLLDIAAPPHRARVLSLGCGVGGMERYWQLVRPDMRFTLQNVSKAQLDLCLCEGERVLGDAQAFVHDWGAPGFDVTVLAYMLGHVDAAATLRRAIAVTRGTILVVDVFDVSPTFKRLLHYDPPSVWLLRSLGFQHVYRPAASWYRTAMDELDGTDEQRAAVLQSTPGVWVRTIGEGSRPWH
jgi:hypothetical protein